MKKPKKPVAVSKGSELSRAKQSAQASDDFHDIREELEARLKHVVQNSKVDEATSMVLEVIQEEFFSGPIPHPRHLKAYEDICPGAADRILRMTEKTVDANNAIPAQIISAQSKYRMRGLTLGFLALIVIITGAAVCAVFDQTEIAAAFLAIGVAGVVSSFINGRQSKVANSEETGRR